MNSPDIYIIKPIPGSSRSMESPPPTNSNRAVGRNVALIAVLSLSVIYLAYSGYSPSSPLKLVSAGYFGSQQVKTSQQLAQTSIPVSMDPLRLEYPDRQIAIRPQLSETSARFLESFQAAKRSVQKAPKAKGVGINAQKRQYLTCLTNFKALSGPVVEAYPQMNATEQRQIAEAFWLEQGGKLWMQHTRKGGGTSLCMALRLNQQGLIKTRTAQWEMPKRETCQIMPFCTDCDLTKKTTVQSPAAGIQAWQGWDKAARLVDCVTNIHQRNFLELEGTVSPPNILTHPEWANYVFISTLRHPIARIISSLHNDHPYNNAKKGCVKPKDPNKLNSCAHKAISTDALILEKCHKGIYFCYANYYVRMFAGHPNGANHEVTRDTLQAAKNNFKRYSCVVLQEEWDSTATCLSSKLGLHLTSASVFNVEGTLRKASKHVEESKHALAGPPTLEATFLESLNQAEVDRLMEVNALDLEFYEWAKEVILSGYFSGY